MKTVAQLAHGTVVLCTVLITGVVVYREFARRPDERQQRSLESVKVADWTELAAVGHRFGPVNAKVTIVEFSDFQCPACRAWNTSVFPKLLERYPKDVAIVYRHWPLDYHTHAYAAARAAECAAAQGRFAAFHDSLFSHQDEIAKRPFVSLARAAGVQDIRTFERCSSDTTAVEAVDRDRATAIRLKGRGTPTLAINGTLYPDTPSTAQVDSIVESIVNRKTRRATR